MASLGILGGQVLPRARKKKSRRTEGVHQDRQVDHGKLPAELLAIDLDRVRPRLQARRQAIIISHGKLPAELLAIDLDRVRPRRQVIINSDKDGFPQRVLLIIDQAQLSAELLAIDLDRVRPRLQARRQAIIFIPSVLKFHQEICTRASIPSIARELIEKRFGKW